MSGRRPDPSGFRRYLCPVCGHVEWLAPGETLPAHYTCPLCGVGPSTMMHLDHPKLASHRVAFEEVSPRVSRAGKRPRFHREYNHFSYILQHPDGLILFDAPPILTAEALATVSTLGTPRLLVVSHQDFVAFAGDWADALGIPAWMGEDRPLPGNRFEPDDTVSAPRRLADDLEVVPVPGHSPGSLAVRWTGAPGGTVLCCGDALGLWPRDGGQLQFSFLQTAPVGDAIRSLVTAPVSLLASCSGALPGASVYLERLLSLPEPCARPWRDERGGLWFDMADVTASIRSRVT